ncbi:phosphatidylserine/phosphatidylglycerophosphate/cardiolipin synthase family protein [Bacillus sp. DX1.1]|uniref:phospholipase D-like domain-containing protein n=1 Tax=unclassified Bacillus (in: firmicutes) TaxID=185979 RepID=UPI002570830D|nr:MULTISPECIES: phosphatidylserine/phosphatidylglycerophosphate/cardiolipin synthase family protein [unclassified Bacillus (in: firmicutes)]MDM5154314.1 phosphatidylserine/phosphatidylglycerophosphate/cardiolipin synthase family protein [Bacillus sp. DX1.1]WJE83226.1 phosphatidylserine/phosphatidylglycerophosphate/cardiolipin synthase family protein [Bacillus sp. DX3.1]
MVKKILRVISIIISIVILIVIWMHIDVTIGRKVEVEKNQPKEYGQHYSDFQLYVEGKPLYQQLFSDIKEAKHSIFTYFYIISDDKSSHSFLKLLKEKAEEGVKVYLSVDWINDLSFERKLKNELKASGVHFTYSRKPEFPFFFYSLHHRNHRRITTIDGKIGYSGGFNIGNEYLGKDRRFGYWRDYQVRLQGEGVKDLEEQFVLDWKRDTSEGITRASQHTVPGKTLHTLSAYNGHHVVTKYIELINEAKQSIVIATPYFIPKDKALMNALIQARQRGVFVKVLWSFKPDIPLIKEAAYPYIRQAIENNISVYGYKKGMFHGKAIVIDNETTVMGTTNFTSRSFYLNDEMNFYIKGGPIVRQVNEALAQDFHDSKEMTSSFFDGLSFLDRCKEKIAGLLNYYL